jgi:GNAT superfamily N-acetyltransferase
MALPTTRRAEDDAPPGLGVRLGYVTERGSDRGDEQRPPDEPHWYLAIVGSDLRIRGKGFGHALMRSRLDRCDAENLPAYLESTNPDNVPYYRRFGFEVTGEIPLPLGGPSLLPMWREPR